MSMVGSLTSFAAIASVAGGMWFGLMPPPETGDGSEGAEKSEVSGVYLELDLIAIPLISDEQVQGYLIGRFFAQTNAEAVARYGSDFAVYLTDAINKSLLTDTRLVSKRNTYDLYDKLTEDLVISINKKLGEGVVESIYAGQLDILEKDAVRMPRETSETAQ